MKKILILFIAISAITVHCKKDKIAKDETDASVFEQIKTNTGFSYYKSNSAILQSSAKSPHNKFFRMRYNKIAFDVMTDNGKLPVGKTFPNGSIVVKELYDSQTGSLALYAVMIKKQDSNSGKDWLWSEYKTNGDLVYSITKKGSGCISCHATDARDYNRIFDLF